MSVQTALIAFLMLCLLSACGKNIETIDTYVTEGRYIEASEIIVKKLKKNRSAKVKLYLKENGEKLVTRALFKGEVLAKQTDRDDVLRYYRSLGVVFDELAEYGAEIPNFSETRQEIDSRLRIAMQAFLESHYKQGRRAQENGKYRTASQHFEAISLYQPSYLDAAKRLTDNKNKAHVMVAIKPFFKHKNGIQANQFVRRSDEIIPIFIQNVPIEDTFMNILIDRLSERGSTFMSVALDDETLPVPTANWRVEGHIEATEERVEGFADGETILDTLEFARSQDSSQPYERATFTYEVYKKTYLITLELLVRVYPENQPEKRQDFSVKKTSRVVERFRSDSVDIPQDVAQLILPLSYLSLRNYEPTINEQFVLTQVMELAVDELSNKILGLVDQDD